MAAIWNPQPEVLRRYARHLVLPEIGEAGQSKLARSCALVVGAGGLGTAAIAYLAAAGIGGIRVVDPDRVELSNLQRQILYETADIGSLKARASAGRAGEMNPDCALEPACERLDAGNALRLLDGCDIALDGSDNFETRFVLSDACLRARKPLVSAAAIGFSGQLSTFKPYLGAPHPCYRCLVGAMPGRARACVQEGIFGPVAGVMGALQAAETIKELAVIGESLSGSLLVYDALHTRLRKVELVRDPACPGCA